MSAENAPEESTTDVETFVELRVKKAIAEQAAELDLSSLSLTRVPDFVFDQDVFTHLDLSHNSLEEISPGLPKLKALQSLDISYNEFSKIPSVLNGIPDLKELDLSGNKIDLISDSDIRIPSLQTLRLHGNRLECVPASICKLQNLDFLDLENNKISALPDEIGQLSNLRFLSISHNSIDALPQTFANLQSLEHFEAEENLLGEIPSVIRLLAQIESLDVSSNGISSIPEWIGELNNLQSFSSWNNKIEEIPESLCTLASLDSLNLGKNDIVELPAAIGGLVSLKGLYLWQNKLTCLPASFSGLLNLNTLTLSHNNFSDFPKPLTSLVNLRRLIMVGNSLSNIDEAIVGLQSLTHFDVSRNEIAHLPSSLGSIQSLQRINLSKNKLQDLPDLSNLGLLSFLDLSENNLVKLPSWVGRLANLKYLDLSLNDLDSLPAELREIQKLEVLYLHDNEKLALPPEILGEKRPASIYHYSRNDQSPQAILSYFFARALGTRPLNEMKLVVVGRGAAGKTSLLRRLIAGEYDANEAETPGIEITPWEVTLAGNEKVRLHAWDFGGQEILHATHQFFFSERCLYLLVLTGRDGQQQSDAEYWLQLVGSFGGDSKVIVVLNKSVQHKFDLNRQTLLEKYPDRIVAFCETDCATELGIDELGLLIEKQVEKSEHRKTPFPEIWFEIKEAVAKVEVDYFSWDDFVNLCRRKGEYSPDRQQILASYLHALGVALNYSHDCRLSDTHVLNPRWVTEGVYTLIRNGQGEGNPELDIRRLDALLNAERYPRAKHDFLIRLMELYQLCFPLPHQDNFYLIPELLPRNQPPIREITESAELIFSYLYSVLPEGILPRFIVQTRVLSEGLPRWRSGVQLRWEECQGVVIADSVDRRVKIYISGPRHRRREFLGVIRQKFDEQHWSLKGVAISEKIPLRGHPGQYVDFRDLLKREARREEYFYPENMDEPINVKELLDGIESPAMRDERRMTSKFVEAGVTQYITQYVEGGIVHLNGVNVKRDNTRNVQQIYGGNFTNSAVLANAEVFNWRTAIQSAPDTQVKDELQRLGTLIEEFSKVAPARTVEQVERDMIVFSEQALAERPDVDYLMLAGKRLETAASAVASFANPILETVEKIKGLIC